MTSSLCRLLCLLGLLLAARGALAEPTLQLVDADGEVDAWPALTMLADPGGQWQVADVLRRRGDFQAQAAPHANFGVRRDALWLRIPFEVAPGGSGHWLLDIDYASLDRVDVHLVAGDRVLQTLRLGDTQPYHARPLKARTHAASLAVEPGLRYELLLRVQTTSSMIVPIVLIKPERYHDREAGAQLLQGVMVGIGLCLLLYSVAQWLSLRDATFAFYGLAVAGTTVFFFAYYGLGPQHLWGASAWLTANMAPPSVLIGLVGGLLFLNRTLLVSAHHPRWSLAMRVAATASGVAALAFMVGAIDYRAAQLAGTVLGPTPIVLGLPAAVARVRAGDRASAYVRLGAVRRGHRDHGRAAARLRRLQRLDAARVPARLADRDGDVAAGAGGAPGTAAPRGRTGRPRARGLAFAGPHRPADWAAQPARPAARTGRRTAASRRVASARCVPARPRRLQGRQRPPWPRRRRRAAEDGGTAAARAAAPP